LIIILLSVFDESRPFLSFSWKKFGVSLLIPIIVPKNNSLVMRAAANKPNINIVAVNDPFIPVEYMEYMYKYDSTHGRAAQEVSHDTANNTVIIDGKPIKIFGEMDPSKIDWVRSITFRFGQKPSMNKGCLVHQLTIDIFVVIVIMFRVLQVLTMLWSLLVYSPLLIRHLLI
jgi:hypothetical protein